MNCPYLLGDFVEIMTTTSFGHGKGTVGLVVGCNRIGVFVCAPLRINCSNDLKTWHYCWADVLPAKVQDVTLNFEPKSEMK